jgi:6-phosphogluconolactonase
VEAAIAEGHAAEWAAARYAAEIEQLLPRRGGLPAFDVWLLGVGSDGHILSTFPGSAAVAEEGRAALAVPPPEHIEPHVPRVTLSPHLLRAAGAILVMVIGTGKADSVAACFRSPVDPVRLPGQLAIRPNAVWLLDAGSAAGLREGGAGQRGGGAGQRGGGGPPGVTPSPTR